MYILYLVILMHGAGSNRPAVFTNFTGEYRTLTACKAASDGLQRAAGVQATIAACTHKG